MLLKTIMFDDKNCNWIDNRSVNMSFLQVNENYVNEVVDRRGYIYLNQICELLGVQWNPEDENPCVINDGVIRTKFVHFEAHSMPNNSFLVNIITTIWKD